MLAYISLYKIDGLINKYVPVWVDKNMLKSIEKKKSVSIFTKLISLYSVVISQEDHFFIYDWKKLERYLDIIIEKIQNTNIKYDAIVGIKTGGAIIASYLKQKLNLPTYSVKVSRSKYNCNKKESDLINDIYEKNILKTKNEYIICEGIDESLEGKNIILIDESVGSGSTMFKTFNYLKNKKANIIFPTTIVINKQMYLYDLKIDYLMEGNVDIWSWGYDN